MTAEELAQDTAITVADLNQKVRESILAGNAHAAYDWAGALSAATQAWRDLDEGLEP